MDTNSGRRRLPHFYPAHQDLFVTWHLAGSLPSGLYPPPGRRRPGEAFACMDRYLDTARTGPLWLAREDVAGAVVRELVGFALWDLHAFAVMGNHVHALFTPGTTVSEAMKLVKGRTARTCNLLLGRSGPFWQRESYDRAVRNAEEWKRILFYIENNPVKAGLVERPEDYQWSSAWPGNVGLKSATAR